MSKIAACLIVKDSAKTIKATLDSIRPFVDGVFIYDTGSTDDTELILGRMDNDRVRKVNKETGEWEDCPCTGEPPEGFIHADLAPIKIRRGEWRDDFSWAREKSFAMPPEEYDWLVWLDDDDVIEGAHHWRNLAASAAPEVDGFVFFYDYAHDERGNCVCQLWRERLMRRSSGFHWMNPIHEVLVPPEGHAPNLVMIPPEMVRYVHNRPPARYAPDRNLKILLREKERQEESGEPIDLRTLAYIGTEYLAAANPAAAIPYLQQYLDSPHAAWSDERIQVHHKLASAFLMLGNPHAAIHVEMEALKERDDWGETTAGLTEAFAMLGKWDRVERWAKRTLELGMPSSMLILNPLEFSFLPYTRLSEACLHTGRHQEALGWLQKASEVVPEHPLVVERREAYEREAFEAEVAAAVLRLREVAVRYDENLKALNIMENVPYVVAKRPEIVKARADQREMCKHYLKPEEYVRWYEDEPKESSLTDDHIDAATEVFGRVAGLISGLREQSEELGRPAELIDLGCNDFWMGEGIFRAGFSCDGIELNKGSYEKALDRIERFDRPATVWQGDLHDAKKLTGGRLYDAVSLFEVIEHVPDIERTIKVCESLLRPGGRVYISTPNGAFENGQLPNWAKVERKGHLRAIPIQDLAGLAESRGEIHALEQTNGDRVAFVSYTPRRKKGKIVFYNGGSWERWSPLSVLQGGIGGSETALVRLSSCLGRMGYEVHVYADVEPCIAAGGVLWHSYTSWDPTEGADLLVVSRLPHVFDNPIGASKTALWCHDHSYPDALTPERAEKIDHIVVLSEWQRERFARLYPFAEEKLVIRRNGIAYFTPGTEERDASLDYAERPFVDRSPRCVYSSSADRGLDVMLDVWPDIREHVPNAELHVFYGFNTLDRVALQSPNLVAFKTGILNKVTELGGEEAGIFLRGRVAQPELAREMTEARVLSYPTAFLETSCITAMEARAAGLPIVTSDLGALHETVGKHGLLIPWGESEDEPHNQSAEFKSWFVREVVSMLTDEERWEDWHERGLRGAERLDWSLRAKEWAKLAKSSRKLPELVAA